MKRFLAATMATAMVFALAACGNSGSTSGSSAQAPAASSQPAQSSAASAEGGVFTIGGIGPLTGGAASYGISVKQGAEIAVNEINVAGGVKVGDATYELALAFADDEAKEDKAITAYNSLMDQGVNAILGNVTSGACMAITDLTAADGILQITPSGSALGCTANDNAFRLCFTDPLQGITMADFAIDDLGKKKIAVIYNNSDEYSTGMMEAFVEEVGAKGGEIVANEAFNEGDVDFSTQLTTIKGTDAEIIFCPIYYEAAAYITKQAKDLQVNLPFIGGDGWDGILAQSTDASALENVIFLSPFLATDPSVADFVSAYEAAYNATPDQFAGDGYDTVYVIAAAMEKAGSIESADLIAAMTEIEVEGVTGTVTFTADGEPNKGAKFITIKDGEYVAY